MAARATSQTPSQGDRSTSSKADYGADHRSADPESGDSEYGRLTLPLHHKNNDDDDDDDNDNGRFRSLYHMLFRMNAEADAKRKGIHPIRALRICFKSTCFTSMIVNVLWPFVPAAIAVRYARPEQHVWVFALNFLAIIPAANLLDFAGGQLAEKLPQLLGILFETTLASVVEIVLFMVLIHNDQDGSMIPVIQAAILGSILANLLLCLGVCFFFGGIKQKELTFHEVISEVGSGQLLVAGFGLGIPSAFYSALKGSTATSHFTPKTLAVAALKISRSISVILLIAFCLYLWYNVRTLHSILNEVFELDARLNEGEEIPGKRTELTLSESLLGIAIGLTFVCMTAVFLVGEIPHIVERGVSDSFMGLILVPLVEKAAEHLTSVDEAWNNQINFALFHCLGPSIQTALLNAPLVVIVSWGLGKEMNLNFEIFMVVLLVLSILVVGYFLRDGKSSYLEGGLCVLVYTAIAVATWYYPNPEEITTNQGATPSHPGKF